MRKTSYFNLSLLRKINRDGKSRVEIILLNDLWTLRKDWNFTDTKLGQSKDWVHVSCWKYIEDKQVLILTFYDTFRLFKKLYDILRYLPEIFRQNFTTFLDIFRLQVKCRCELFGGGGGLQLYCVTRIVFVLVSGNIILISLHIWLTWVHDLGHCLGGTSRPDDFGGGQKTLLRVIWIYLGGTKNPEETMKGSLRKHLH